jgi:S-DNA-T family DNA segregation ATPase FtsK/SpoIIIE
VDILGEPVVADLAPMPHLLVAGATGAGKSVVLASIIMSILYKASPDQVRLLMIDPKRVEFSFYRDIPHLIYPVLTEPAEANLALKWAVAEMENRYRLLAEMEVRHIDTYNEKVRAGRKKKRRREGDEEAPRELPYLVIIIDELNELMMVSSKEVEVSISRLGQKARAAGIHLIMATQRPTTDIITGTIKSNLPTRIALRVFSQVDSRTILDQKGAEKLLGRGDMLFLAPNQSELQRLHGPYLSDGEIQRVTDFLRAWGPPDYLEELTVPEAESGETGGGAEDNDPLYDQAVELVRRTGRATISHIQRHLRVGYNRAARFIERMEREGLIGPQDGTRPREIF